MSKLKKETIIVDFLNFGLLPIILKLDSKKNYLFIYLFSNKKIIEEIVKIILKIKKVRYKFIPLNSKRTYKKQSNLSDELTHKFIKNLNLKKYNNEYLEVIIGNLFYKKIYKVITPYIFVENLKINHSKIYLQSSPIKDFLIKQASFEKLYFYKSIGSLNCYDYFYNYNVEKTSFFEIFKSTLKLFLISFFIFKKKLPVNLKNLPVFYLNQNDNSLHENLVNALKENNIIFLQFQHTYKIIFDNKRYDIRVINLLSLQNIINKFYKISNDLKIYKFFNFSDKLMILRECFDIEFIKNFLNTLNPPLFFSNDENKICLIFQCLAKNHNCVTIASTLSYGYFPARFEGGHQVKFCDVYFVWGKKHSDLLVHSNDQSTFHIITGKTENFRSKNIPFNYDKLICFVDNTFYNDIYLNQNEAINTLKYYINFALKNDYKIIIKTKKYKNLYKKFMNNFPNVVVFIDDKLNSISSYPRDTIFIGYSLFSIGVQALRKNSNVYFYDKYSLIWDKFYPGLSNFIFKNKDFISSYNRNKLINKKNQSSISKIIDFEIKDTNTAIIFYMMQYLKKSDGNKEKKLEEVNTIYKSMWGKETLVYKKNKSSDKFITYLQ
jgi:hypothetical protein